MKHLVWNGLFVSLALLSTASCSDGKYDAPSDGTGSVALSLDVDGAIISATPSRSSLDELAGAMTSDNFTIRLTDASGDIREWSYNDFTTAKVKSGVYTLEAFAGKEGEEGFDKPYFAGSTQVVVAPDVTTEASVTASLANSCVTVRYTDAFTRYMTAYSASVRTEGSTDGLDYPVDATDELFVNAGATSLYVTFTTPQNKTATLKVAEFTAAPQHRYNITVDVNGGEVGDAVLSISFDDTTLQADKEITLSDELLNMPAPTFTPAEINLDIIQGEQGAAVFDIVARGGIAAARLVTESKALTDKGWPAEIDLVKADAATQATLTQMGLKVLGLWKDKESVMARIDLSGVIPSLGAGESVFRVEVEDAYGKVSSPSAMLRVNATPLVFEINGNEPVLMGDTQVTLNVTYNGGNPADKVKFTYYTDRDTWAEAPVVSATAAAGRASDTWTVVLKVPDDDNDIKLRAQAPSLPVCEYAIGRVVPDFTLSVQPNDVFASYAIVNIGGDSAADIISRLKFTARKEGAAISGIKAEKVSDTQVKLSRLPASSSVEVSATLIKKSASTTFTTEAAAALPNGSFENLHSALTANDMNLSGEWSISWPINYQSHQTYAINEPDGWATVNAKTASSQANTQNSWFVVPSTFNTSLSWTATVPNLKVGGGGGTETPASCQGFNAFDGSNAMVIRNVGWDLNGSTPGLWRKEFSLPPEYYNQFVPTVANASAGKLFLGSYSFDNGSETYNEGVSFTSRPSALKGHYTYKRDADPSETGMAVVEVYSGSTRIGSGRVALSPADSYTEFTVPVTYVANAPKATSVRVMLTSSNHASYNQAEETAAIKTSDRLGRYEAYKIGAVLAVDALSFTY